MHTQNAKPDQAPGHFLVLPPDVRPSALSQLKSAEVLLAIQDAPLGIFATHELQIVGMNSRATPAFAQFPAVIGMQWPDFLRRYWAPDAAAEVIQIVEKSLVVGTPYSSIGFAAERWDESRREQYDWEVHRIITADRKRMLLCYFAGPL